MPLSSQKDLRAMTVRHELGAFLNANGLTGKGVEVGTLYGAYATDILKDWQGHLYCVDPWRNQAAEVYHDGQNKLDMEAVWQQACNGIGRHPRCTLLRMMGLNAVGRFDDGELDFVYLDGNHAVDAVRADILAWWPKIKVGGILCGHDFFTRYDKDTNSDALTAVMELCEAIGVRVHCTWCTSWWIVKTADADAEFMAWNFGGLRDGFGHGPFVEQAVYTDNKAIDLVVVLPVAKFDWNLACKWLRWTAAIVLDGDQPAYQLMVYCSPDVTQEHIDEFYACSHVKVASGLKEIGYFGSPNQMFKGALEYCEKEFPGKAVLWCEADTVPMRSSWVREIRDEYRACGRPFMGDIIRGGGIVHSTGNAVYHPQWRKLAPSLAVLGQEECGWDSLCAHDIVPRMHVAKTIQQIWRPKLPITQPWANSMIRPETALFHQCKDGSLIDVLCARKSIPLIPLAPALCESTYETQKRLLAKHVGPLGSVGPDRHGGMTTGFLPPPAAPRAPVMEIMIVAFHRDIEFLRYCLKSITKFAKGFSGVTLVVPSAEAKLFSWVGALAKVKYFDEAPGKGMLHHEVQICRADEWCPLAEAILLMDADCMFWRPTTPADFAPDGKLMLVRELYAEAGRRNPNRLIWQKCVEGALGFKPDYETMVRHPQVHYREVFKAMRDICELHTGKPFDEFVLSQDNSFPQGFAEHPTLGAVAIRSFDDRYTMVDYDHDGDARHFGLSPEVQFQYLYRRDRDHVVEFWSHGGIKKYESDAQVFLQNRTPEYYMK